MNSKSSETVMEWQYSGVVCTGRFMPATGVAILNFITKGACVTVTYRLIDADGGTPFDFPSAIDFLFSYFFFPPIPAMAVCIVEVDDQNAPTIQYGTMYRIDPSLYRWDRHFFFLDHLFVFFLVKKEKEEQIF